jgi:hypothetical protein
VADRLAGKFAATPTGAALLADADAAPALRAALEGMVYQFAHWAHPGLWTGGLSALEEAFDVLGWDDPHPAPEQTCDEPGCDGRVSCGWPSRPGGTSLNGGYRHTCGEHMRAALAAQPAPAEPSR